MSHEMFCERIALASPHPQVEAALNDDPVGAGIITPHNVDPVIGSRLFNVATAAMDVLRADPKDGRPVQELVAVPDADRIERFVGRILIGKLLGNNRGGADIKFNSGPIGPIRTDGRIEAEFADEVGLFGELESDKEPARIYATREGNPALLEKEFGERSALSLKAMRVNRVDYPAGTLFVISHNPAARSVRVGNYEVVRANKWSITSIAPARFTRFAFPLGERDDVFATIMGYPAPTPTEAEAQARTYTLRHIVNALPPPYQIKAAITKIRKA